MWLLASLNIPSFFKDKQYVHCPVLELKILDFDTDAVIKMATLAEGFIITSQEIATICEPIFSKIPKGKHVFCTGPKTQESMKRVYEGIYCLPHRFDQEGLVDLISASSARLLFYPKAATIRPYLIPALEKIGCKIKTLDCYRTQKRPFTYDQKTSYEGIYFGSSQCAEAFYQMYQTLPSFKVYVPGLVTKATVEKLFGHKIIVTTIPL